MKIIFLLIGALHLLLPFTIVGQIQMGQTITKDSSANQFGYDIDLSSDGKTLVIGCPRCPNPEEFRGLVQVFQFQDNFWHQLGSDILEQAGNSALGNSVAISGDGNRIAAAAPYSNINNIHASGCVKIFDFSGTDWVQSGECFAGDTINDYCGLGLALSDDGQRLIIGCPNKYDNNGVHDGKIKTFDYLNGQWLPSSPNLRNPQEPRFGNHLALSGDGQSLAVRTSNDEDDEMGKVYFYQHNGSEWESNISSIDVELIPGFREKSNIALSDNGSRLIVGELNFDWDLPGKCSVYELTSNQWVQVGSTIQGATENDYEPRSVDISGDGNRIALGTIGNHNDFPNTLSFGRLRVLEINSNSEWVQMGENVYGEFGECNLGFGVAFSSDGSIVASSASHTWISNNTRVGYVKVYGDFLSSQSNISSVNNDISIFPNPASTYFQVNNSTSELIQNVSVIDIQGKEILSADRIAKKIDISYLNPGIYLVNIKTADQQTHTEKLIIQR